jgi:hypothetical protein
MIEKYPRTFHLPFSPKVSNDDKKWDESELEEQFFGTEVLISEKMDGSNVCLTNKDLFARSHSSAPTHPSFGPLKVFHQEIKNLISDDISFFGEYCFAVHSVKYTLLPHFLNIFAVRFGDDWLDWDDVQDLSREIGVPTVPVILSGCFSSKKSFKETIESFASFSSVYGPTREGLVIRRKNNICQENGKMLGIGKYVNSNFVPGNEHWSKGMFQKQPIILKK